jgi:UDP-glucose 4-epimerase
VKALVTGGAGFIGSHLVEQLLQQGVETIVFDNLTTGNLGNLEAVRSDVNLIHADIRDTTALLQATEGVDWVFHLAALTSVVQSVSEPLMAQEINITGTLNTLWAAHKNTVSRVVIASSCSVYGNHQPPHKESDLPAPRSPYAASKLTAEVLAESFYHSYGLETVSLRYFNVYGARQRVDSDYAAAIPRFLQCYRQQKSPQVYGDGLQSRDFIHVTDIARANILAAALSSQTLQNHRVFNVGTGHQVCIIDLLNTIATIAGYPVPIEHQPGRAGEVRDSCADCTLAETALKFQPAVELEAGIAALYGSS